MQRLIAILISACMIAVFAAPAHAAAQISDYRDIPGVTQEEIAAIEALKSSRHELSYGSLLSTEAFLGADGAFAGYTLYVCELLTELFGIRFSPAIYDWNDIIAGITDKSLDFSGDFSLTPERERDYYMSGALAVRSISLFHRENEHPKDISDIRTPVLGFLKASVHVDMMADAFDGRFETVLLERVEDAHSALKSGKIDAFVCNSVFETLFEKDNTIITVTHSPLIFDSVSLTTGNPELVPIISVFDKYIENGGRDELSSLYALGLIDHTRYTLFGRLNDEEIAYIENHIVSNQKIPVILESGNYPISFYNETSGEYQGIVPDLLERMSTLTGLRFESINDPSEDWPTVLARLQSGEAALISELLYTPSRRGLFLWPDEPSDVTNYAMLSKADMPCLEVNQLLGKRIGVEEDTAYHAMASQWFPEVELMLYSSTDETFDALEGGEIDLIMASENILLSQTNFREKPGYKINFIIDYTAKSMMGFNIDQQTLLSIFVKAYPFSNNEIIVKNWASRTFDYSGQLAQARVNLLLSSTVLLAAFIALLFVFLLKNTHHRRVLSKLVNSRTIQLAEKTLTLSAIYNTIPDMLYSKDIQGRYTSCNHSFETYLGLSEAEILGKSTREALATHLDSEELARLSLEDEEIMTSDSPTVVEQRLIFPDGEPRLMETIKTALRQEDDIVGMIGISRDITAHKAAQEAALDAAKAKGSFLARMSHEIRTPLNAIIGMAEIMRGSIANPEKIMSSVNQIVISSHHLLGLINNVLDMSKIESGSLEMLSQPMNFREALEETIAISSARCIDKSIAFEHNIEALSNLVVFSDKLRLNQVLINLLSNAIKFTDANGCVSFMVNILEESTKNIYIEFVIKDNGIGMTPEQMARLFKPFEQADNTIASRFGGTGLGLSISHSLVQKMGGDITIDSAIGEGSSFRFALRFDKGEASQIPSKNIVGAMDFSGLRILLVEDIEINRYILKELLASTGLEIDEAENGRIAVEMLERKERGYYKLILMDVQMPEMNGYEATIKIRNMPSDIPIIAMTANAYKEDMEQALEFGMNAHLGKPIDMDELMKALSTYLLGNY